jgi:hypothetical protein
VSREIRVRPGEKIDAIVHLYALARLLDMVEVYRPRQ